MTSNVLHQVPSWVVAYHQCVQNGGSSVCRSSGRRVAHDAQARVATRGSRRRRTTKAARECRLSQPVDCVVQVNQPTVTAAVIWVLCRACVDIQHGYVGSDKGWTRSVGCVPPSPPTPDHRHSLAAPHLEHGAIAPLSMSPHQRRREIGEMASVRPHATHATGCTCSTSDRLLFRQHRSHHVQRATTNDSAHHVECWPATLSTYSMSSHRHRRASPTQPRTIVTTGAGHSRRIVNKLI